MSIDNITPEQWDNKLPHAFRASYNPQAELTFMEHKQAKALETQIGGNHYKNMAIQPVQFCLANNLGFCEANVIKYVCRYKDKGGMADLQKAKHYLTILMEHYDGSN